MGQSYAVVCNDKMRRVKNAPSQLKTPNTSKATTIFSNLRIKNSPRLFPIPISNSNKLQPKSPSILWVMIDKPDQSSITSTGIRSCFLVWEKIEDLKLNTLSTKRMKVHGSAVTPCIPNISWFFLQDVDLKVHKNNQVPWQL